MTGGRSCKLLVAVSGAGGGGTLAIAGGKSCHGLCWTSEESDN